MKHLRQFFAASILVLSIALSCFAGDMHTGIVEQPPSEPAVTGNMDTPGIVATDTSGGETGIDSVAALAEYLFSSMMSSVF
jgi:hypothetical protein